MEDNKKSIELKLKDIKPNPCHPNIYNEKQVDKLASSIKTAGIMRSFAVFKIKNNYHLVCGHHLLRAAIKVFGKDKKVSCEVNNYDEDTADWGMMIENLTQMRTDKKRNAIELRELKQRLKNRFKDYHAFVEFMKSKGVGVAISHSDKRKDGQAKRGNNYPEVGSVRFINSWLNRMGNIVPIEDIADYLMVIENLSPTLFNKISVGDTNRLAKCPKCGHKNKPSQDKCKECSTKLEKKEVFNWSNAVLLAQATKDNKDKQDKEKEQEELLKALKNSNEARVHRVRTRAKLVQKYKKLKSDKKEDGTTKTKEEKEKDEKIVKAIREGKKDISLVELPNSELPKSSKEEKNFDYTYNLIEAFEKAGHQMEEWLKKALPNSNSKEIVKILTFLQGWSTNKASPFIKRLIKELALIKENPMEFKFKYD